MAEVHDIQFKEPAARAAEALGNDRAVSQELEDLHGDKILDRPGIDFFTDAGSLEEALQGVADP